MRLIPHDVGPRTIHGIGCFASRAARKGERVWKFHPLIDRMIHRAELKALPIHAVDLIRTRAKFFPATGTFILGADGDSRMNHSDDANFLDCGDHTVAGRDIAAGDELSWDYRTVRVHAFPVAVQRWSAPSACDIGPVS